jgi:BEN domain
MISNQISCRLFVVNFTALLKKSSTVQKIPEQDTRVVDIGYGLEISAHFLDVAKAMYKKRPSLFMKRLVYDSGVFELEYVAACSLTGYKTSKSPDDARPALDPVRVAALKRIISSSFLNKHSLLEII